MRCVSWFLILGLGLLISVSLVGCGGSAEPTGDKSGVSEKESTKAGEALQTAAGEAEKVADKTVADVKETVKEEAGCAGCAKLKTGETGWCADCGTGFFEGKEVNCKGSCMASPGGPPCQNCVK